MRNYSRPSSISEESYQEPNYNIWSTNQNLRQSRPSSFDSIWGSPGPSIWAGNSGQAQMSSPPDFLSNGFNQQVPLSHPTQQPMSMPHPGGTNNNYGPRDSVQSDTQDHSRNAYEASIRRHSYGDVYNMLSGQGKFGNQPAQGMSHSGFPRNLNNTDDMNNNLQLVDEYFELDPHERVKVTLKFLNERFFDEEKYLGDSYQLPKFPVESSLRNYQLVLVGFKAGRIDVFYLPQNSATDPELSNLKVGDLVIVEADRGRDLGKIFKMNISIDEARLLKLLQFQEQQASLGEEDSSDLSVRNLSETSFSGEGAANSQTPPTLHFPKSVISLAQNNEIMQILNKKQDEEKACRLCLAKIANSMGLLNAAGSVNSNQSDLMQMKLIDAEYQFDRKKLIFYYSTSKRIDFRDLVRELFRIYKTRIWMCAVIGLPYVPNQPQSSGRKGQLQNQVQMPQGQNRVQSHLNLPPQQQQQQQSSHLVSKYNTSPTQTSPLMPMGPFDATSGNQNGLQGQQHPIQYPGPGQFTNQFGQFGPNYQGFDGFPRLNDPFNNTMGNKGGFQLNPPSMGYDRRFSLPQSYNEPLYVPRNFSGQNNSNTDKKDDNMNESFVLKSLVDSINH